MINEAEKQWHLDRSGLWTASEIWKLFVEPKTKADREAGRFSDTAETYILEKAVQRKTGYKKVFVSKEMDHGIANEYDAFLTWQSIGDSDSVWQFTNKEFFKINEISGASPDAVIYDNIDIVAVADFKCPQPVNFFSVKKDWMNGEEPFKNYFYQIQMQMMATKASIGFLVYYLASEFMDPYSGETEHKFNMPAKDRIFWYKLTADPAVQNDIMLRINAAEKRCQELMKMI